MVSLYMAPQPRQWSRTTPKNLVVKGEANNVVYYGIN